MIFLIVLALLSLTACQTASKDPIEVTTVVVQKSIPIKKKPRKPQLRTVDELYVVNEDNLDEFISNFKNKHGKLEFVALTSSGYQKIQLNLIELKRYITQQDNVIVYYEDSIKARK